MKMALIRHAGETESGRSMAGEERQWKQGQDCKKNDAKSGRSGRFGTV